MKSIRTNPRREAVKGDERIRTAVPSLGADSYYVDRRLVSGMGETVRCPRCAVSPADTTEGA